MTKRDLIRYTGHRPGDPALPRRRRLNLNAFRTGPAARASGRRTCPKPRPPAPPLARAGTTQQATPAGGAPDRQHLPRRRRVATLRLPRQPGDHRDPRPGRAAPRPPSAPPMRSSTSTRAPDDLAGHARSWPASSARRSATSASRRSPRVTGKRGIQAWIPVEPRHTFAETAPGSRRSGGPSGPWSPSRPVLGVVLSERRGRARLDYTQNAATRRSSRRTPSGGGRRRSRHRSPGTSSTTPTSGPIAGRSGRSTRRRTWRPVRGRAHRPAGAPPPLG